MIVVGYGWVDALEQGAPDVVAAWRGIEEGSRGEIERLVRQGAGRTTAEGTAAQLATLADALSRIVESIAVDLVAAPGGEADWNVAQTVGHVADARAGLCLAAAKAAAGTWPMNAQPVVPGVPGPPDADRATLLRRIGQSQRIIERCARTVAGSELDPCPLDHPLIGRLRCGEWLVFAGVHDLMHLEQLHDLGGAPA